MKRLRGLPPSFCTSLPRSIALALPLALLATLVVAISVNAFVLKKTESTLVDFDSGTFLYTGLLDLPDVGVDSVQLLPIGLTGAWDTSSQLLPLPVGDGRANVAAAATEDYIYVVGGTNGQGQVVKTVYSSKMSVTVDLTPWTTELALPAARAGASMAAWPLGEDSTMLYVVGGFDSTGASCNTIYQASVDHETGTVGTWVLDDEVMPDPLHYASVVEHDDYLYVIGGSRNLYPQKTVYYAPINPDGSLGTFLPTAELPEKTASSYAVVYEGPITDTVYVVGGTADNITATFKVYFADFLPGGELTEWTLSKGNLPIHLYAHSGVLVSGGEILVTGGIADSTDPSTGISSTVKAALVDSDNATFRLYDWCLGVEYPTCTIGAWQTGALMPDVRALHASVSGRGKVYVIGGQDGSQKPRRTVFYGPVSGIGSLYSPEGTYVSNAIPLGKYDASLRRITWDTTIGHPGEMGLTMQYRTSDNGTSWSPWSEPITSTEGINEHEPDTPPTGIRFVEYRANFTTAVSVASPLLNEVEIFYEVADPDVQTSKDTGPVISVPLGANLVYTIYYSNTGHYMAPNVVLTETLPDYTTYAGSGWQQVGSSNVYTRAVGDVGPTTSGHVPFEIQVSTDVPETASFITNTIELDFPPLLDAFELTISDPVTEDNFFQFRNPLDFFVIAITKTADPPTSEPLEPGAKITYTIYYTNVGTRAASQAVVTDFFDLEGDYTIISADPPPDEPDGHVWTLGRLPGRTSGQIEIVAQLDPELPNNWKVTNQAMIYSPEDEPQYTGILTHTVVNPPETPLVDLTVTNIRLEPSSPRAGEPVSIIVDIENNGDKDAGPFLVELYVKPAPSTPPIWPSDHEGGVYPLGGGAARPDYLWYPAGLASNMGASLTFPSPSWNWYAAGLVGGTAAPLAYPSLQDGWSDHPFPLPGVLYDVYVQIDVVPSDNPYWGAYAEADETNNIEHMSYETPPEDDDNTVYLPLITKNY